MEEQQFEQRLCLLLDALRPGVTYARVDCERCGFFGYLLHERDDYPEHCPRCGLDGNGAATPDPAA